MLKDVPASAMVFGGGGKGETALRLVTVMRKRTSSLEDLELSMLYETSSPLALSENERQTSPSPL